MKWAVWYVFTLGPNDWKVWKYVLFETYEEAREYYIDARKWLPYDEFDYVEPPVPYIDGRPQEPEYVDLGCSGQISMFDSTFMMELDAELEAAL